MIIFKRRADRGDAPKLVVVPEEQISDLLIVDRLG
jgi:hypothetical protein